MRLCLVMRLLIIQSVSILILSFVLHIQHELLSWTRTVPVIEFPFHKNQHSYHPQCLFVHIDFLMWSSLISRVLLDFSVIHILTLFTHHSRSSSMHNEYSALESNYITKTSIGDFTAWNIIVNETKRSLGRLSNIHIHLFIIHNTFLVEYQISLSNFSPVSYFSERFDHHRRPWLDSGKFSIKSRYQSSAQVTSRCSQWLSSRLFRHIKSNWKFS